MKTISLEEFFAEAARRFGESPRDWKFVCPMCGTIQSPQDFVNAGLEKDKIDGLIGFSCIGRVTGQGDAGISAKNKGLTWDKGCNWTLGGLLRFHETEVDFGSGKTRPVFEFAPEKELEVA